MQLADTQIKKILQFINEAQANLDRLREIFAAEIETGDLDPMSPKNKDGKFLTERGIEVCFRLFDRGENPYGVAKLMGISYTAAANRHTSWEKIGGKHRKQQPLN
ncbi:hypothetical protein [Phyllobacterium bourgognense]|uniref:Uncharacterized protein n=1 Tax=Phyllobacterium bourgognense TaxID=314236 RepID=A0A368Z582_9HYPH|nr:hypothetical protein [Phyllobacterium bourgognense]RCW87602.1 hypothetical protein C7476_101368 [Phyllobacterium bourgognense]